MITFASIDPFTCGIRPLEHRSPMRFIRGSLAGLTRDGYHAFASDPDFMDRLDLDDDFTLFYSANKDTRSELEYNMRINLSDYTGCSDLVTVYDVAYIVKNEPGTACVQSMAGADLAYLDDLIQGDLTIGPFVYMGPGRDPEEVTLPSRLCAFRRKLGVAPALSGSGGIKLAKVESLAGDRDLYVITRQEAAVDSGVTLQKTELGGPLLVAAYHEPTGDYLPLENREIDKYIELLLQAADMAPGQDMGL